MRIQLRVAALAAAVLSAGVSADVVTIGASHDATIYSGATSNSNGAGPGMFVGTDGTPQVLRSLLQFDVAGHVPQSATITGVQLKLWLGLVAGATKNPDTTDRTIQLHRLNATWGEGTTEAGTAIGTTGTGDTAHDGDATWSSRFYSATTPTLWGAAGGDFAAAVSASSLISETTNASFTWSSATMTSDVQGWLDTSTSNAGWELLNTNESSMRTFRAFYTSDSSDPTMRPQLTINYTPVPEPAILSVAGVFAIGLWRRRSVR